MSNPVVQIEVKPGVHYRVDQVADYLDALRALAFIQAFREIQERGDDVVAVLGRELLQRSPDQECSGCDVLEVFIGHGQVSPLVKSLVARAEEIASMWPDYAASQEWIDRVHDESIMRLVRRFSDRQAA